MSEKLSPLAESSPEGRVQALRGELLPVAESLDRFCQLLAVDAGNFPEDMEAYARAMGAASQGLLTFVAQGLSPPPVGASNAEVEEQIRHIRLDIGNRINQVQGYGQLFRLELAESLLDTLADELIKIEQLCYRAMAVLQRHKGLGEEVQGGTVTSSWSISDKQVTFSSTIGAREEPASILVVDDTLSSRDILVRFLRRQGHDVSEASDGREAIEKLREGEFDLVLLDCMMPEMDGVATLQAIKRDERLRHTPVIVVSALDRMRQEVQCIEIGAEDFLPKPIDLPLLRARTASCLERKRLREREYAQFFTPQLARHFARFPQELNESREATVTMLFCDIRGFSRTSELLGPSETLDWLQDVIGTLSDSVIEHRGVLVDYIGDALLAMFGALEEKETHADQACLTALDMLARVPALNAKWKPIIGQETRVGIGINTGVAQVGNTGTRRKFKYGPLGPAVNLASRVQGATKYLRSDLLITGNTHKALRTELFTRRLCTVRVVNIDRPVELHEVRADAGDGFPKLKESYEQALVNFENGRYREAASLLGPLLVDYPEDGPALLLMSRVIEVLLEKPESFDPVWVLPGK